MKRAAKILWGLFFGIACSVFWISTTVQASDDEEGPQIDYSYVQEMIDSGELTVDDFIDMDDLTGWATYADDGLEGTTGGGDATPQLVTDFWGFWELAEDNVPRVIVVAGNIYCPYDTGITVGRNKTIVGIDENATVEGGIILNGTNNVIISNLNFKGGWRGTGPEDAILIQNSHHIWLDHLNVWDGRDGNIDIVTGSSYVTVSWCKMWYTSSEHDHRYSCLVGNGAEHADTDAGRMNVTYHHNWFGENIDRRMPWILYGKGHMYNNYYNSPNNTNCIEVAVYSEVLVENNYFKDVNNPHTFLFTYARPASITASGNIYDNTRGVKRTGKAGPNQDTVGYFTNPPYEYTLDVAEDVPEMVMEGAGVRNVVECPYDIVERYLGDVDMDGNVTATDALQVLKYVVKLGSFNETQLTLADVDLDVDVDAEDALAILKMVVKLEPLQTIQVIVEKEIAPTKEPIVEPTVEPTVDPTTEPTANPTAEPTVDPTAESTTESTVEPTQGDSSDEAE